MHQHTDKQNANLEQHWQDSQDIFSEIYKLGLKQYVEKLGEIGNAFNLRDTSVRCIDEGTPGGIHIAGSGILLNVDNRKKELEEVIKKLQDTKVDGVYSHAGCGAAQLYAKNINDPDNYEKYAIDWAKKLAELLDVLYKGHITELERPKEFHNARIAYYDGSGKFNPSEIKEMPDGFVVSRRYLNPEYAKSELTIALSIAMGHHGFGEKFTEENPFIIAPIESSTTEKIPLKNLEQEVWEAVRQFGKRVIINGFQESK